MIIPIVVGRFGTVTKGLLKGLDDLEVGGRVETIQTAALLRTARILRKVLKTWGRLEKTCCHSNSNDVKNFRGVNNDNNKQVAYAQSRIHPGERDAQSSQGFLFTNRSLSLGQIIKPCDTQQRQKRKKKRKETKKRTGWIVDFAIPAGHRVKLKESEKNDTYLHLAWELKKTMEYEGDNDTSYN